MSTSETGCSLSERIHSGILYYEEDRLPGTKDRQCPGICINKLQGNLCDTKTGELFPQGRCHFLVWAWQLSWHSSNNPIFTVAMLPSLKPSWYLHFRGKWEVANLQTPVKFIPGLPEQSPVLFHLIAKQDQKRTLFYMTLFYI